MSEGRKEKILLLVRHAHQNKPEGAMADSALSKKGRRQAEKLVDWVLQKWDEPRPALLSSPKLRCLETLQPLSVRLGVTVQAELRLDEQTAKETAAKFRTRVRSFYDWWCRQAPLLTVACSHGDFLPVAIRLFTGARAELEKGGIAVVAHRHTKPELLWLLQQL